MKVQLINVSAFDYLAFDMQDVEDLIALASASSYWETCFDFIVSLKDRDKSELTPRQTIWAQKIQQKLIDKRRQGKL